MPIRFSCAACQTTINAPDKAAGEKARCPRCKAELIVSLQLAPEPEPKDAIRPPQAERRRGRAAFEDRSEVEPETAEGEKEPEEGGRRHLPRREPAKGNTGLVVGLSVGGGALLLVALAVVLVVVLAGGKEPDAPPQADKDKTAGLGKDMADARPTQDKPQAQPPDGPGPAKPEPAPKAAEPPKPEAKPEPAPKPPEDPKVAKFRARMLEFLEEAKSLTRSADIFPSVAEDRAKLQKVRDLFTRIPDPPERFKDQYLAARASLGGFALCQAYLELAHQYAGLSSEQGRQGAKDTRKDMRTKSAGMLKALDAIEATLEGP
jgi:hypothetical protein